MRFRGAFRAVAVLPLVFSFIASNGQERRLYEVRKGAIDFSSEAPKELISASSHALTGLIDPQRQTFSFRIPISSFKGFNNPLQQEHFNENYMESRNYPDAVFSGKIMETADLSVPGTYQLRGKGKLMVHGISVERLIPVTLTVARDRSIALESSFTVALAEHAIKIPRVVYEKLSPEIKVHVIASLAPRP